MIRVNRCDEILQLIDDALHDYELSLGAGEHGSVRPAPAPTSRPRSLTGGWSVPVPPAWAWHLPSPTRKEEHR